MQPFHELMKEYQRQMANGVVRAAYKGLMEYIMELRIYFGRMYPEYSVSGSIYHGYMDMTYFSVFPESLWRRKFRCSCT